MGLNASPGRHACSLYRKYTARPFPVGSRPGVPEPSLFLAPHVNNNPINYYDPSGHAKCSDSDNCAGGGDGESSVPGKGGDTTDELNKWWETHEKSPKLQQPEIEPPTYNRGVSRSPSNPKNYWLKPGEKGLSTTANPPVTPDEHLELTGRVGKDKVVQIPENDIPEGLAWEKTQGTYGEPKLDQNHWELWSPDKYTVLGPEKYVDWWNNTIAPDLGSRAPNWGICPAPIK